MATNRRATVSSTEQDNLLCVTIADELFAALDGQVVTSRQEEWQVRIYGIHQDRQRCWVQVHLSGPEQLDGTLMVDPSRPASALRRFRACLASYRLASDFPALSAA